MEEALKAELSNIREIYFEYPIEPVAPEICMARQKIHYLLGVIDAMMRKA